MGTFRIAFNFKVTGPEKRRGHTDAHTHTPFSSKWQVVVPLAKAASVGQCSDRKFVSSPKVDSTLLLL